MGNPVSIEHPIDVDFSVSFEKRLLSALIIVWILTLKWMKVMKRKNV